jgi:signal transduction histidine kinase
MKSIESKLNTGLGLSLIVVFTLLGIGVSISIRLLMENHITVRLEHDAESLLAAVSIDPSGDPATIELLTDRINRVYDRVFSGHYFVIASDHKRIRSRSLWDQDLPVPPVLPGKVSARHMQGPENQNLLVRVAGYRKDDKDLVITVAEDLTPIDAYVQRLQIRYGLTVIVVLALLVYLQRQVLRQGLGPLDHTGRQIEALERGELERLSEDVPLELRPLVQQINQLLSVLRQRMERSRNALGNLAHALKMPLTLMNQLTDKRENIPDAGVRSEVQGQVRTIQTLIDRELRRARLSGARGSFGRLGLAHELNSLVEVVTQLYRDKALKIDLQIPAELEYSADREDMLELFGNLLDNACKWATSMVRISGARSDQLWVRIEDDGPGASGTELDQLRRRGIRVDEGKVPGYGLGLAIAQDVVQHYAGTMTLGRSDALGGFMVEVRLPLQRPEFRI